MEILDNPSQLQQRDPHGALEAAKSQWEQLKHELTFSFHGNKNATITNVVVAGMGGSALAAGLAKDWLNLGVPFEVVRTYDLPNYVNQNSLVIASSFSGNTEETLSAIDQAVTVGAQVAVATVGGKLKTYAEERQISMVQLPEVTQPRLGVFANLLSIVMVLETYGLLNSQVVDEFRQSADWLSEVTKQWVPEVSSQDNLAKQLAWQCAGKTPVIYASSLMRSIAYKWKISFNENSKNVAFCSELPEFNHNEFMGWTSHPMQKPYAVIDLISSYDHPQIIRRFEISDRLLSGMRPHAITVHLGGETIIQQMMWACVLADFSSIYLGILNGVDPTPVELVTRLKQELA